MQTPFGHVFVVLFFPLHFLAVTYLEEWKDAAGENHSYRDVRGSLPPRILALHSSRAPVTGCTGIRVIGGHLPSGRQA